MTLLLCFAGFAVRNWRQHWRSQQGEIVLLQHCFPSELPQELLAAGPPQPFPQCGIIEQLLALRRKIRSISGLAEKTGHPLVHHPR